MHSRSILGYIHIGTILRYLHSTSKGHRIHGGNFALKGITDFLDQMEKNKLTVTLRVAEGELIPLKKEFEATGPAAELNDDQVARLHEAINVVQKTLYAEATGHIAYIVSDKRYDVHRLLTNVGSLFSPYVFDSLPKVAKYDFSEAGRCIAFERPTAAAFHLLRGTEDVLRTFYRQRVRRNRISTLLWGPMVEALRKLRNPPPAVLTNDLDNIRLQFRNPTQHPEKTYDIEEVQDLFGRCIDVVNRMMKLLG